MKWFDRLFNFVVVANSGIEEATALEVIPRENRNDVEDIARSTLFVGVWMMFIPKFQLFQLFVNEFSPLLFVPKME